DMALDLVGLGADVVAQARAAAFVRRQQAGEHADGRGLARAVATEEAVDGAAPHLHGEIAHDLAAVEGLGEPFHVDRDVGGGRHGALSTCVSATLTGCPTRSRSGRAGRASTKNTSF